METTPEIGFKTLKRIKSFEKTDAMPAELRGCVHEYGFAIVAAFLDHGIRRPSTIHHIVREVWEGARQPSQRRDGGVGTLDWLLLQAGANISATTLLRIFQNNNLLVVPNMPTRQMLAASMAEVSGFNERMTKTEKHRRRLVAALRAAADYLAKPERQIAA